MFKAFIMFPRCMGINKNDVVMTSIALEEILQNSTAIAISHEFSEDAA
jgi:hypothetical protein